MLVPAARASSVAGGSASVVEVLVLPHFDELPLERSLLFSLCGDAVQSRRLLLLGHVCLLFCRPHDWLDGEKLRELTTGTDMESCV